MLVNGLGQLLPGVAQGLVAHYQRLAAGEAGDGGIEGVANALGKQGFVWIALGVAWLGHGNLLLFLWCFGRPLRSARLLLHWNAVTCRSSLVLRRGQ
ncbi:hypothetical protein D3C81_1796950 [compost metagenome]